MTKRLNIIVSCTCGLLFCFIFPSWVFLLAAFASRSQSFDSLLSFLNLTMSNIAHEFTRPPDSGPIAGSGESGVVLFARLGVVAGASFKANLGVPDSPETLRHEVKGHSKKRGKGSKGPKQSIETAVLNPR